MRRRNFFHRRLVIFSFAGIGILILGAFLSLFLKRNSEYKQKDNRYLIKHIIQTGPQKEALKTVYLAELLGLSQDYPINLYNFDTFWAKKELLKSPLIKKASVKKIEPDTIYIDYQIRTPVAWLYDYQNIAIDNKGYLFPVYPFLTPKQLPQIYVGLPVFKEEKKDHFKTAGNWHQPLQGKCITLALQILRCFSLSDKPYPFQLKMIDVSNAFFPSYGKREIVVFIEDELVLDVENKTIHCIFPMYLRLGTHNYRQQIGNYCVLRDRIFSDYKRQLDLSSSQSSLIRFKPKTIDLRIDKLAFIDNRFS